jgi:hypothetical protein
MMPRLAMLIVAALALGGCWGGGAYQTSPVPTPADSNPMQWPPGPRPIPGMPDHDGDITHREIG